MTAPGAARTDNELVRRKIMGYLVSQAILAVNDLGVPACLAAGPMAVDDLAEEVGAHAGALRRFLRVLVGEGLFEETAADTFALTAQGALLRPDVPGSLRHFAELMGAEAYTVWASAGHSLRTGEAAFAHAFGAPYFAWLADHPDASHRFDQGQSGLVELRLAPLLDHDWSRVATVVDVGGGDGTLLARLLSRHPSLTGTTFDLPHVVESAARTLTAAGVQDRATAVGGDFLDAVPSGGDVYVLSQILHDWADPQARQILATCRAAMPPGGEVLIVEQVLPERAGSSSTALLDLHMLVLLGGQERTLTQWEQLLAAEGFELGEVTHGPRSSLLRARPIR